MTAPLLDTHVWVWWVDRDRRLSASALEALDAFPPEDRPSVADISLWEVATLVERGRLEFSIPLADWLEAAAHPRSVRVLPVTPAIAAETAALPANFPRDPADRLIVATARVMNLPLLTKDRQIRQSRVTQRWSP